jgi:hypothetical protein
MGTSRRGTAKREDEGGVKMIKAIHTCVYENRTVKSFKIV